MANDDYVTFRERLLAIVEDQQVTERCARCPEFVVTGPLRVARAAFRSHVEVAHPSLVRVMNAKRLRPSVIPKERPVNDFTVLARLAELAA